MVPSASSDAGYRGRREEAREKTNKLICNGEIERGTVVCGMAGSSCLTEGYEGICCVGSLK